MPKKTGNKILYLFLGIASFGIWLVLLPFSLGQPGGSFGGNNVARADIPVGPGPGPDPGPDPCPDPAGPSPCPD